MVSPKELAAIVQSSLLGTSGTSPTQRIELTHAIRNSFSSFQNLLSFPPPKASDRAQVQSREIRLPDSLPISLDDQDVAISLKLSDELHLNEIDSVRLLVSANQEWGLMGRDPLEIQRLAIGLWYTGRRDLTSTLYTLLRAVVMDHGVEPDLIADIQGLLEDLIKAGLRQRLIALIKELNREEPSGLGGPLCEQYLIDSRGALVERRAVVHRERLILGHCLVLSILVDRPGPKDVKDIYNVLKDNAAQLTQGNDTINYQINFSLLFSLIITFISDAISALSDKSSMISQDASFRTEFQNIVMASGSDLIADGFIGGIRLAWAVHLMLIYDGISGMDTISAASTTDMGYICSCLESIFSKNVFQFLLDNVLQTAAYQNDEEDMIYVYNAYLHKLTSCFLSHPIARDKVKESKDMAMSVLNSYRISDSLDGSMQTEEADRPLPFISLMEFVSNIYQKEPELLYGNDVLWTFVNFAGEDHTNFKTLVAFLEMLRTLASTQEGASKVYELLKGTAFRSIGWATLFDCIGIYDDKFKQSLQTSGTVMPDFLEGDAKALVAYLNVLQKVVENGNPTERKNWFPDIEPFFKLLGYENVPPYLKGALRKTIATFVHVFPEMRDSIWAFLEQYDLPVVVGSPVGKTDQSSQVYDMQFELNEIEARREQYPSTISFLNLINALIAGEKDVTDRGRRFIGISALSPSPPLSPVDFFFSVGRGQAKMANSQLSGIIEKMTGKDKDYRYMATSDLLNELNKDSFKLDSDLEMRLSSIILQQLDDVAGDVSGLAVKCLAPLVKKVGEERVVEMTNKLCDKLLHGKDQHRDTASIALRTVVAQVAPSLAPSILVTLTPQMIGGISGQEMSPGIKCECLEIMCDVVQKYGSLMADDHEKLLNTLLLQLDCNQATVRKKTVTCIASLASSLSDDLLAKATVQVVKNLSNKNAKSEITRTNIQMIGAISRAVGYRFGTHLGNTVPVLINYCTSASENEEELREYSLQALESFLLRCPRDISPYCDEILNLTLEYISYDPNFTDEMDEDTDNETPEDEEDDESANEYTDDEDASWKVRRAAAKCLAGLIVSRSEMISKVYQEACPKLIDRFKEREENVKMDVFNTFIDLLRQTGNVTKGQTDTDESSPKWLLKQEVSKIVKSINRQLREKSVKTKVGAFSVLRELVVVLPDCLADHIGSLVPGIERALNDKSSTSNLKIEALVFTKLVLASHAPPVFHPYIKALSSPVLAAVGERYYKVTAEALRVCGELVRVVRPSTQSMGFDFKPFVHPIYNAIMSRLTNQDQDQEVKECAITCMGLVISIFGDELRKELPSCLPVLVDRMGNEITRLTAVKAFAVIATSPLHIDLSCVLVNLIAELTGFLRKANRVLRQATLITMNTLVTAYGDKIGSDAYEVIVVELSSLISVLDLHMTALALELCCTLMTGKSCSENISLAVRNKVLPQALTLVKSPLLQGQALLALQGFFEALVYHANTSFYTLLDSLLSCAKPSPQSGGVPKQALYSIAQCVAVLCLAAGDKNCSSTVKMLMEILKDDSGTNTAKQHLALLSLGEIGRRKDLSAHAGIETIVIESFQSPFEEIKSAASYALGNIAVGNLPNYLPFILNQIDNQQKKQYILLHSLKEVIVRQSVDKADFQNSSVEKILALLFNHCESEEEGVRNVVAECLGKMALIEPEKLVPALKVRTTSQAAFTRATVVTAVKYSVVERPEKLDEIIFPEISSFLMLIKDGDRHVRRAAVSALSTFAHYKPNLIKGLLPELLPLLYDQTVIKKELIRTVDLGPFKHVVDDGLELRKAAFECVFTLLDSCLDQLNPSSFIIPFLKSGLEDHYDLKMLCHLILSLLADKCPSAVLAVLDSLVEPLQKTINFKPKQDAVKQEHDRNEDMIRSALRAISSLDRISGVDYSHKFKSLMADMKRSERLWGKYQTIRNE